MDLFVIIPIWVGCSLLPLLSLSGIPPLSGFLGKVFITKGSFEASYFWLGAVAILTSLMVLYSDHENIYERILGRDDDKYRYGKRHNKGHDYVPNGLTNDRYDCTRYRG